MCSHCGGELPPHQGGPPRKFCSITCKEAARSARRRERYQRDEEERERRRREAREAWGRRPRKPKQQPKLPPAEKRCADCSEVKSTDEFYLTGAGYPKGRCKECEKARLRERYARDPEVRKRAKARAAAWQKANPERNKELRRRTKPKQRLKSYGLTVEDWDALLIAQAGRCAICEEPMRKPCVDHCHDSKRVRGLLCKDCNTGIGHLRDDVRLLRAAIEYLGATRV